MDNGVNCRNGLTRSHKDQLKVTIVITQKSVRVGVMMDRVRSRIDSLNHSLETPSNIATTSNSKWQDSRAVDCLGNVGYADRRRLIAIANYVLCVGRRIVHAIRCNGYKIR